MATELETVGSSNLAEIRSGTDRDIRRQAFGEALKPVDDPRAPRPIPRFMQAMPWGGDNDEVSERIIAAMLASDDPYGVHDGAATVSGKDLLGRLVTVHDVRCNPSDKPGGWGAYLLCDVTIDDSADHEIMTVGAKEIVAKLALAWYCQDLPLTGTIAISSTTASGNTVYGFVVETPF